MLRSHWNHQYDETQVRAWSLPVQQWQQIQGPVSGWEEGPYIIIYPLLLGHHHHYFQEGFGQFWWTTGRHAGEKFVGQFVAEKRQEPLNGAIKKAVRKGKTLRLLGLSIPFLFTIAIIIITVNITIID